MTPIPDRSPWRWFLVLVLGLIGLASLVLAQQATPVVISPGQGGVGYFASGTSAAPSITFQADPFDGFYRFSTGNVIFSSQGNPIFRMGTGGVTIGSANGYQWANTTNVQTGTVDTAITRAGVGEIGLTAVLFANLGTPANGSFAYCSDCLILATCAGVGTGAFAKRLNSTWVCN